jgi:CubicO group peptidase (beta-lactamase class C family)
MVGHDHSPAHRKKAEVSLLQLALRSPVRSLVEGGFAALARRHGVPGAQLTVYDGRESVNVCVGEARYGSGRPVTRETAFPIGSVTKVFTAAVAMILVADGDLELDVPLGAHLPEIGKLGDLVTLRQLLSHTGGLPCDPDVEVGPTVTPRRYVSEHCRAGKLLLAPGTAFSYSNMGFVLTGHLVAEITGMSWWEAVESILLRPLRIAPAFVAAPRPRPPARPVAAGHSVNPAVGRTRPVGQSLAPAEGPAGALAVSAADLVALGRLHTGAGSSLLPACYAGQMRQPVRGAEPFGLADGWGLGLAVYRTGGVEWVGHDGNADGTSCHLRIEPDSGYVVGFTSNASTGTAMWHDLLAELDDAGVAIGNTRPWTPTRVAHVPERECVGAYVNGDVRYVVASIDGRLLLSVDGDDLAPLTLHEDLTFALRDPDSGRPILGGRFVREPFTGNVDGIQIGGRLARRHATVPA